MNLKHWSHVLRVLLVVGAACTSMLYMRAQATTADISNIPLGTRSGANIAPNLMFILDDSGSMARNYMPDAIDSNICKTCSSTSCNQTGTSCAVNDSTGNNRWQNMGHPPFAAYQFNTLYYNPAVPYAPAVDYLNVSYGNQTPTTTRHNPFSSTNTITKNVASTNRDFYWCTTSTPTTTDLTNTAVCRRNGFDTGTNFHYQGTAGLPDINFRQLSTQDTAVPYYYVIAPREYCSDESLISCTLSSTPVTGFTIPAPVRWCRSSASMGSTTAVTGGAPRLCQALTDETYRFPRLGLFTRVNIVTSTTFDYPRATTRSDCTGPVGTAGCTGAQELQNYANWYSYYSTRLLTMKTVPGRVFASIGNDINSGDIRIGFLTINANSSAKYLKINDFKNNAHRQSWFNTFYGTAASGATPLREALSRVGRHFAGITTGLNSFMPDEPVIASCQRNYALLTTDGYWNGNAGANLTHTGTGISTGSGVPTVAAGSVNETTSGVTAGTGAIEFFSDNIASTSAPLYVDRATTGTLDAIGTVVTTVTPTMTVEHAVCTGNALVTFSTGVSTQACGCTSPSQRIVARNSSFNSTLTQTDGVGSPTTSTPVVTFTNVTACAPPLIVTDVTPTTLVEQQVLAGNGASTFGAVNGVSAGANQAGSCPGAQRRIKQRTTTFNTTVATTNSVAAAPTVSGTTYTFQDIGTCATVIATSVTSPVTLTEQQVLIGTASSTFAAIGGVTAGANQAGVCPGAQRRVKQRRTTYDSTVVTTDGVAGGATLTNVAYVFTDPGTCVSQTVTATTNPVTVVEEQVLVGNATSTFGTIGGVTTGANQAGLCTAPQRRIKRRTTTYTSAVSTVDGVVGAAVISAVNYTFSDPGACVSAVTTATTPVTVVQEQVLTNNNTSTFAAINGVTTGANQAGVCSGGRVRIKRRTTTFNSVVTTTDGVAGAAVISGTTYSFSNPGACILVNAGASVTITPVIEVQTVREANTPTNFPNGQNNGDASQTAFTNCSGANRTVIQRTLNYVRIVVSAPASTTFAAGTATFDTLSPCSLGGPSASGPTVSFGTPVATTGLVAAGMTTTNGTVVNATVSSYPTAAATTTTNGTTTNATVGTYPTAASTTTVNGAVTNTTVGTYPTAGASTNSAGTPVVTNNGGIHMIIALTPNPTTTTSTPTITTTAGGTPNTLADVALYYYRTDLRTTGSFAKNNVPTGGKFIAPHQHMVTFTLGLGLDGQMTYRDDYESATTGDFFKIKTGATNCIWTTGTCNWPVARENAASAIDDLWHAAVNGRGKYFSAKVPAAVENGIKETLASINVATGSAAAAATSTPNLTTTNNSLFSSTYRTVDWDGEIVARTLDPATGLLTPTPVWSAQGQLNMRGLPTSDTRSIYTFDGTLGSTTKLKSFVYTNLTASEQAYFNSKCIASNWNQCTLLATDTTRLAAANSGTNLVNWLRGHRGNELNTDNSAGLYRRRTNLLGDTVNGKPAYMPPPELQFEDLVSPTYGAFKTANASRTKLLFVAANDGMLHALNADTGSEVWAYIPKQVMPGLFRLANADYKNTHAYFVDGSPTVTDVFFPTTLGATTGAWKSVLVGDLNSGGRGYYALDVTDPANPKALWEICADAALCAITDTDLGLSYGQPVIGKLPSGKWVVFVTSGYNNIGGPGGTGGGFLYVLDIQSGAVLYKVGTMVSSVNVGDSTTPSGLARVAGFVDNFIVDNTIKYIYGGDLLGNMWRFDMAPTALTIPAAPTVVRIGQAKDGGGKPQSITTRPELTKFDDGFTMVYIGTGRFLGESDLGDPAALIPAQPFAYQQTVYGFKDTGADLGDLRHADAKLVQQTLTVVDAATRSVSNNPVNLSPSQKNGWYVDLNPANDSPGERVNIDVTLVRGTVVVIANEPNGEQCSTGGDSFLYQFTYDGGTVIPGTPGNVAGTKIGNTLSVGIVVFQTTTGQIKSVITTSDGKLPQAPISTGGASGSASRAAWRELIDTRTSTTDTP